MEKLLLITIIFVFANSFCFAEDENEIEKAKEYSIAVHLHPISFVYSLITLWDNETKPSTLCLYSTLEIPCSPSISLTIRPSLWNNVPEFTLFGKTKKWFRWGTDLGIRYYLNKEGKGFYVQGTVGLFHIKEEEGEHSIQYYQTKPKSNSFFEATLMGYLGYSIKPKKTNISIFFDVEVGYSSQNISLFHHVRADYNLGVGMRF